MALCTLDEVKLYLGIDKPASDELLTMLIDNASAFIENYTNRTFAITEYTEVKDGTGGAKMPVYYAPITELKSVKINDLAQTGYKNTESLVWFINGNLFASGTMNVELIYDAGFATVPNDVKQACIDLTAYKFKQKDRIGLQTKTLAGEVVSFEMRDIREDTKNKLAPYVRVV